MPDAVVGMYMCPRTSLRSGACSVGSYLVSQGTGGRFRGGNVTGTPV